MALTQKPGPVQSAQFQGEFPEQLPHFPEDVLRRYPFLGEWQSQMDKIYFDLRTVLRRLHESLQDPLNATGNIVSQLSGSLAAQVATIQTQLLALQSQLEALEAEVAAAPAIGDISDDLAAHIADKTTHGTATDIVGIEDIQNLENKNLGLAAPKTGRFRHLVGGNVVALGETVSVPVNFNMIVAGVLTVDGVLDVAGTLLVL